MIAKKSWKTASSIILLNTELREVLMLQRSATAKFMPNSFVFPGGTLDEHDLNFPRERTNFNQSGPQPLHVEGFHDDFPLRVAAVRELFEESGLLMIADENCRDLTIRSVADDPNLEEWRTKVFKDPRLFSHLFVGSTKMDVDSLIPWSNWLTPMKSIKTTRYDTVFFVVSTAQSLPVTHCVGEMADSVWTQPSKIIEKSVGQGLVSLPPPQYYELLRIRLAVSSRSTSLDKMMNSQRIAPQVLESDDDPTLVCNLMYGDYMYDVDEPVEMVAPKRVSRQLIFNEQPGGDEQPIHRMTYRSDGSRKLQYIYHQLNIQHLDRMPGGQSAHLFHFNAKDYISFF